MQSQLLDAPQSPSDSEVEEALAAIPEYTFQEAISALTAAPPVQTRLLRQPARRLAIQLCDQKLKAADVPRAERRRLLFNKKDRMFNFSDIARGLQ